MKYERALIVWMLWLSWIMASVMGYIVGGIAFVSLSRHNNEILGNFVNWLIIGGVGGLFQWFILSRYVWWAKWWAPASVAGVVLFFVVWPITMMFPILRTGLLVGNYTIYGATVGIMQWYVLRRHVSQANWWVWCNIAGNYFGDSVVGMQISDRIYSSFVDNAVAIFVYSVLVGAVISVITGTMMVWLLRRPILAMGGMKSRF